MEASETRNISKVSDFLSELDAAVKDRKPTGSLTTPDFIAVVKDISQKIAKNAEGGLTGLHLKMCARDQDLDTVKTMQLIAGLYKTARSEKDLGKKEASLKSLATSIQALPVFKHLDSETRIAISTSGKGGIGTHIWERIKTVYTRFTGMKYADREKALRALDTIHAALQMKESRNRRPEEFNNITASAQSSLKTLENLQRSYSELAILKDLSESLDNLRAQVTSIYAEMLKNDSISKAQDHFSRLLDMNSDTHATLESIPDGEISARVWLLLLNKIRKLPLYERKEKTRLCNILEQLEPKMQTDSKYSTPVQTVVEQGHKVMLSEAGRVIIDDFDKLKKFLKPEHPNVNRPLRELYGMLHIALGNDQYKDKVAEIATAISCKLPETEKHSSSFDPLLDSPASGYLLLKEDLEKALEKGFFKENTSLESLQHVLQEKMNERFPPISEQAAV